jgi:hypothetical protein
MLIYPDLFTDNQFVSMDKRLTDYELVDNTVLPSRVDGEKSSADNVRSRAAERLWFRFQSAETRNEEDRTQSGPFARDPLLRLARYLTRSVFFRCERTRNDRKDHPDDNRAYSIHRQ